MNVRAFFSAVKVKTAVSPYNTITLKIYYPATPTGSEIEQMTGVIPANQTAAPFPIIIFMPGINIEPSAYHWLAQALTEQGFVVVTYLWVAEEMPGYISITPGVNIEAVKPESYGKETPSCPALTPIINHLAALNATDSASRLAGCLDLDTIILGGHSAGGTMALQSVNPNWFPQVKGAFTYGAHTMASTMLGYAPGTVLPIVGKRPLLIIGGEQDGVIEASTRRYGTQNPSTTFALEKTFSEAAQGGRNDQFLLILSGANHFTFASPLDQTTGRPFLDHPTTANQDNIRAQIITLITLFIQGFIQQQPNAQQQFTQQIDQQSPLITLSQQK